MIKLHAKQLITGVGKPVSQIALGTAFYNVSSKEEWFGILGDYVESGGTIIDSARGYGTSEEVLGSWLAWLLHKSFPIVPIVGPHTREELASCIKATSLSLTEAEIKWLNLEG